MKACPDRLLLERLLNDRLADTELDELDRHVKGCASCQRYLEELTDDPLWKSELRREVSLAFADTDPERRGARPGVMADGTASADDRTDRVVPTVPGYEIDVELGRGGTGVVYRARHVRLNRTCALKMILAGVHAGPEDVARFVTEAEAIARLQHPSIVQIRHIGDSDGLPFLELEYLPSGSLDRLLDGTPWPATRAAHLVEQVALGIAEAHRQGIVHRDLKPSNVLLAADGMPRVGDFGLAKMLDSQSALTRSESVMGSPSYMAPEQAEGRAREAGPAVDVYAVGAILYELLTGRPRLRGTTAIETIEQVKTTEPVAPSRLVPGLPRDIETICLKCLRKEPGRRYESAQALGDDVRRFLDGRPILARRTGGVERAWRWCRRNRLVAAMTAITAAAMIVLAVGATMAAFTFRAQRDQIRRAGRKMQENLLEALTEQARATRFSRRAGQRFESLRALGRAAGIARELEPTTDRLDRLRDQAIASLALPDVKAIGSMGEQPAEILMCSFDNHMNRYAVRLRSGAILVRGVADDREIARFRVPADRNDRDQVRVFGLSPDGRYLATTHNPGYRLTVWDVDRNTVAMEEPKPISNAAARFSPDGREIAVAHLNGSLVIHDLETRRPRRLRTELGSVTDLAFRPDGRQIAITSEVNELDRNGSRRIDVASQVPRKPACFILDTESGRVVRAIALPGVAAVSWSPDGATLAIPDDKKIDLWDAPSGILRAQLEGSTNGGLYATFHPSGTLLASTGWDGRLRLWDAVLGRPVLSVAGSDPTGIGRHLLDANGQLVLRSEGRMIRYQVEPALEFRALAHVSAEPMGLQRPSIRRDDRLLAVGSDKGVILWDLASGTECAFLPIGPFWNILFEPDGELLTSGWMGVWRWPVRLDADRGEFRIGPPSKLPLSMRSGQIAEDGSGRIIARAGGTHAEALNSGRSTRFEPLDDCRYVALSPDGQWLATGSHHLGARVWSVRDGKEVHDLPGEVLRDVFFSPDGKWLLTGYPPCKLWTTGTWALARELVGKGLGFSPDSRLVVLLDEGRIIRLVEAATGRAIAQLESPEPSDVIWATFSRDGSRLVLVSSAVHVWDLRAIRGRLAEIDLDWDAPAYPDRGPAAPPLPPSLVDLGPMAAEVEHLTESPAMRLERHTARIKDDPNDAKAHHRRGHALADLGRLPEAIDAFEVAVRLRADDAHLREILASLCNDLAWHLAAGPFPTRDVARARTMVGRALELASDEPRYLSTLGIAEYRAGRYDRAIATLERSLATGRSGPAAFDLYFLAMAHHRQGRREQARACYDRALLWMRRTPVNLNTGKQLLRLRAETEAVLAGPEDELPDEVFAPPSEGPPMKRR